MIINSEKHIRVNSTLANQLALFVTIFSQLQMAADKIENYENNAAFKFIEDVPTVWHETRVPMAKLGEYVVMARRFNNNWYLGGQTNQYERLCKIPLSFLSNGISYVASVYADAAETNWYTNPEKIFIKNYLVTNTDTIYAAMEKCGGIAISFVPEKDAKQLTDTIPFIATFNKLANEKMKNFSLTKTFGVEIKKHLAYNAKIKYIQPYSEQYTGGGDSCLVDGANGGMLYNSGYWQGYNGNDMEVVIDMRKAVAVNKVSISFLQMYNDWIFLPMQVEVSVSTDNITFNNFKTFNFTATQLDDEACIGESKIDLNATAVRYIKIKAKNRGLCPDNHPGAGQKAWLFCDEVVVE